MITIPNLKQEVFDIVSNHLLTQMKRSSVAFQTPQKYNHENCKYRTSDGLKCAAGILIPDDQYDPKMEGKSWHDLVSEGLVEDKFAFTIYELQGIHDWTKPEDWKIALIQFAKENNLTCSFDV
jgi:hypothetical protein